jgi:hypothetical protein
MTAYNGPTFVTQEGDAKIVRKLIAVIDKTIQANTVGRLPSGAVIHKVEVGIRTGFDGSSATIDVGNADTVGAYMANTAVTEATPGAYVAYPNATLTEDTDILATVGGTVGSVGDATIIVTATY